MALQFIYFARTVCVLMEMFALQIILPRRQEAGIRLDGLFNPRPEIVQQRRELEEYRGFEKNLKDNYEIYFPFEGYIEKLKTRVQQGNYDLSNWKLPSALKYPFRTPNRQKELIESFKNLAEDWFTYGDMRDERKKGNMVHILDLFAWACYEIRTISRARKPENILTIRSRIYNHLQGNFEKERPELVTIRCDLEYPGLRNIIPIKIAKKHHTYENHLNKKPPKFIGPKFLYRNFIEETLIILLKDVEDAKNIIRSSKYLFRHHPMDMINIVRKIQAGSSVRAGSIKNYNKKRENHPSVTQSRTTSQRPDKHAETKEIVITRETFGYLTSMEAYAAFKRSDIQTWAPPGIYFSFSFTNKENGEFLTHAWNDSELADITTWKDIVLMSDALREHYLESYIQACLYIRNKVGSKHDENLRVEYQNNFISPRKTDIEAIFECALIFSGKGKKIDVKLAKLKKKKYYLGGLANPRIFPGEEFFLLINYRKHPAEYYFPLDMIYLEEGLRDGTVVRYYWDRKNKLAFDPEKNVHY